LLSGGKSKTDNNKNKLIIKFKTDMDKETKVPTLSKTAVSDSDLKQCVELVLSFLKDKECVSIPTRALFKVVKVIENKNISFTFTNVPKSKWTVIHALHCHCH
jgi:hypothetical protein